MDSMQFWMLAKGIGMEWTLTGMWRTNARVGNETIQLASAMYAKADVFVTNDARLAALGVSSDLQRISLAEWEIFRS